MDKRDLHKSKDLVKQKKISRMKWQPTAQGWGDALRVVHPKEGQYPEYVNKYKAKHKPKNHSIKKWANYKG